MHYLQMVKMRHYLLHMMCTNLWEELETIHRSADFSGEDKSIPVCMPHT